MNISLENVDKVSALLTVKVEKADYQDLAEKSLKTIRQKAQIPGFRKGMVPMSVVQKMYRKSVVAEEVGKLLSEKLYGYLKENTINILGEPMPNEEKQPDIDFNTMEEFEFVYDLALSPEFELKVSGKDKVDYYEIEVSEDKIDAQVKEYTNRTGRYEAVDTFSGNDYIKGLIVELDEQGNTKEGGIAVENCTLFPFGMKDKTQQALFEGSKVGDRVVFNLYNAYNGDVQGISSLLGMDKSEVADVKNDFYIQIEEINHYVDGELTQEIYDQAFGPDVVKTEDEFRAKLKQSIANLFALHSDYKFMVDARHLLMQKVGALELPETLLKRYLAKADNEKDMEVIEKKYQNSVEDITWNLIKEKLMKEFEVKVEYLDIFNTVKNMTRTQFAQYGMLHVPEDILDSYTRGMIEKDGKSDAIVNRTMDDLLIVQLKEKMKLNVKTVSLEEFNQLTDK